MFAKVNIGAGKQIFQQPRPGTRERKLLLS